MTDDFRIHELEKDVAALQTKVEAVPVLIEQIKNLNANVIETRDETKSTRRTLIAFCFSVALACIVGLIGVLQVVPH